MTEPGRHIRLTSTVMLKRWLLLLPVLLCATVAVLLAVADGADAYLLVAIGLVGGVATGLAVLPPGEGPTAPPWLVLLFVVLWLPGAGIVAVLLEVSRAFVLGCVAVALMAYVVVAAVRIVGLRQISWDSIVRAPWRS